eukprot:g1484.t1
MDWVEAYDEQGNLYYYNNVTGEQSWDPPADWGQAAAAITSDFSTPDKPKRLRGGRTVSTKKKASPSKKSQKETYTRKEFQREQRRLEAKAAEAQKKQSEILKERNACRFALDQLMLDTDVRFRRAEEKYERLGMFFEETVHYKDKHYRNCYAHVEKKQEEIDCLNIEFSEFKEMHAQEVAKLNSEVKEIRDTYAKSHYVIKELTKERDDALALIAKTDKRMAQLSNAKNMEIERARSELRDARSIMQLQNSRHERTNRVLIALFLSEFGEDAISKLPPYLVRYAPRGKGRSKRENESAKVIQNMCRNWLAMKKILLVRQAMQMAQRKKREAETYEIWEKPLLLGQPVDANYGGEGEFYPATITAVYSESNTYDIEYNDGDAEDGVERRMLRPIEPLKIGQRIEALYGGGKEGDEWFPGTVKVYYPEDFKVDVLYDDGDTENGMRASCVRPFKTEEGDNREDDEDADEKDEEEYDEDDENKSVQGALIDLEAERSDGSESEEELPIVIREGPKQFTAEELGFTHSVPDNSFAEELVKISHAAKPQISRYMEEAKELLESSLKVLRRKPISTKELPKLELELGILERDLKLAMRPPKKKEEKREEEEDNVDDYDDDESETEDEKEEEKINENNTEGTKIDIETDNDEEVGNNKGKDKDEENSTIMKTDKNKDVQEKIERNYGTENNQQLALVEEDVKVEDQEVDTIDPKKQKLIEDLKTKISAKEKEIFDKRRGEGDLIAPDDTEWASIVTKSMKAFDTLQKRLDKTRKKYLDETIAWSTELKARSYELETIKTEETALIDFDRNNNAGGDDNKDKKDDKEGKNEDDLGPEIFPKKDALEMIQEKMKKSAPHLDQDCLTNREKEVKNPDYIPDELLDPDEDPNDPERAPEFISASKLSDYKLFFDMLDKKIQSLKKKKEKRDAELEARAKEEEQKRIEEEIKAAREAAEKKYLQQRIYLTKKMSEACQRTLRAEGRQWAVSAHQSLAVQNQMKQLNDTWKNVAVTRERLERESMRFEEEYSQVFSKLDKSDNALHFMSVQKEAGAMILDIQQKMAKNYEDQIWVSSRRNTLIEQLLMLQRGEQYRQESQVKGYITLTTALKMSVMQFKKSDMLWKQAELCNKPYHENRLTEIRYRIQVIEHMQTQLKEAIEVAKESAKRERKPPVAPKAPPGWEGVKDLPQSEMNVKQLKYKVELQQYNNAMVAFDKETEVIASKGENLEQSLAGSVVALAHLRNEKKKMQAFIVKMANEPEMLRRRDRAMKEADYTTKILLLCHSIGDASDARGLALQTWGAVGSESLHHFLLRSQLQDKDFTNKYNVIALESKAEKLQTKLDDIEYEIALDQEIAEGKRKLLDAEMKAVRHAKDDALSFMRSYFVKKQEEMEEERRKMAATIKRMAEDFSKKEKALQERILGLEEVTISRKRWVEAMQEDLRRLRATHEDFTSKSMEKDKKHAHTYMKTRQSLKAKSTESSNRKLWIEALENKVGKLETRLLELEDESEKKAKQWAGEKDSLRRESWRRDETARIILTDIDELFAFFSDAIDRMAGRSKLQNDKLRENCAVEVLLALCKSPNIVIMRQAVRSLGRMVWDGNADGRVINHLGREMWIAWTARIANKLEDDLRKDAEAWQDRLQEVKKERGLWAAAAAAGRTMARKAIMARLLHVGATKTKILGTDLQNDANIANQERVGSTPGTLQNIADLTKSPDGNVQRYACEVLAVVSLQEKNRDRLLQLKNFLPGMISLLDVSSAEEVQSAAASTLANLAYNNPKNIQLMGTCGAVLKLTKILVNSKELDVLATVTAALINMLHMSDFNRSIFHEHGGVKAALNLCHGKTAISSAEVQANSAELLANATCLQSESLADVFKEIGVRPLVLLCASKEATVQRQIGLIIGNLSLFDEHRASLIKSGAVHALLLLVDKHKENSKAAANALWALSNLAWSADAQDQIGKYMEVVVELCQTAEEEVQENAVLLLANVMYFHEGNRRRMTHAGGTKGGGLRILLRLCSTNENPRVLSNVCRVLGTSAHNDENAIFMAENGAAELLIGLCANTNHDVQQYAVWAIGNMAVHDGLKTVILEAGAVDAVVKLNASDSADVRKETSRTLDILGDMVLGRELSHAKRKFGAVPGLIDMLKEEDPSVREFAAEELAKESWAEGKKAQDEVMGAAGVDALISMLEDQDNPKVVLRALWAIRNVTHGHDGNQNRINNGGATEKILRLVSSNNAEIAEAAIMCLIGLCSSNTRNCRRLLSQGLDGLLQTAERGGRNAELALDLLKIVGPYSYILCTGCGFRNPGGKHCRICGGKISFFVLPDGNQKALEDFSVHKSQKREETKFPTIGGKSRLSKKKAKRRKKHR